MAAFNRATIPRDLLGCALFGLIVGALEREVESQVSRATYAMVRANLAPLIDNGNFERRPDPFPDLQNEDAALGLGAQHGEIARGNGKASDTGHSASRRSWEWLARHARLTPEAARAVAEANGWGRA